MLYKQSNFFLSYRTVPISSSVYTVDLKNEIYPDWFKNRISTDSITLCPTHNHIACEMIHVRRGVISATINSEKRVLYPGDILFLNPFDVHSMMMGQEQMPVEYQVLNFDLSILTGSSCQDFCRLLTNLEHGEDRFDNYFSSDSDMALSTRQSLEDIHHAYIAQKDFWVPHVLSGILSILTGLLEHQHLHHVEYQKKQASEIQFTRKIVCYVSEHYAEELTTSTVAAALGFDKSYFCRLFQRAFNITFIEYLNSFRINVAKNMSVLTNQSISEIADAVGYSNYNIFSKHFKKYTGLSPKSYYNNK